MPPIKASNVLFAAALLALGAAVYAGVLLTAWRPTSTATVGTPFVLASSKGGTVDQRSLDGQPYAVFFGFTRCTQVCPSTLNEVAAVLNGLGEQAKDFRVFFITVDPDRDTVETLRGYLENFDPRIEGLVPTPAQLQELATGFRIFYAKVPQPNGSYSMDHTASAFLFGADGRLADTMAFGEAPARRAQKIGKLLSGG
ncbi:MAG: SCO family protein [Aestuariivirga sp.]|uniref:SCO family protein n=1 Tax=Aestuariivirga sp. TaxID=2650926 RepID=UPI0038D0D066